ncbi:cullin-5 [Anopheles gambiae]|uniref:Cullin-5 n=1 Tax=Anopheles gambiae TaxID=7165 RepID=A0A1S4GES1_ANOGA|nr:cullin-5 [Anopheles coluzzii]XP_312548.6 cullin-5 [Anopheles gambiae]
MMQKNSTFEDKWPSMRPVVLSLLKQERVTPSEWQELFFAVHLVCLWDDKGPLKIHESLQQDIVAYIKQAQCRVLAQREEQALLKAYIVEWRKFFTQSNYLPLPFAKLESCLQSKGSSSSSVSSSGGGASSSSASSSSATVTGAGSSHNSSACASGAGTSSGGGGGGGSSSSSSSSSKKPNHAEDSIVRKLMLDSWNQSIFMNIKHRLQESAMKLVHAERNGEAFDSQLVIGVRESYVNLCSNTEDKLEIYRENFEAAYLHATSAFYRLKASEQLQTNGVKSFMEYADAKLREEEARGERYLEPGSITALGQCCVTVLIGDHLPTLLAECAPLIEARETQRLQLMFRLLDRVAGGVDPMLRDLENHIVQAGLADMVAAADIITQDSEKYVERLLKLFRRFSDLVKEAFNDDPRFLTARDKAFKTVVNDITLFKLELPTSNTAMARGIKISTPESKCPELLANYCDMLLRRTPFSKRLTTEEIESRLKDVLLVLKYVSNKDVFMRYHKAHLTRRLILDSSADSEKEEDMVEWLREVGMPADYVNKLARMFQDIKVSEDLNTQFRSQTTRHDAINIKILNAGAWARGSERVSVSLPLELEDYIPEVEEFYKKKHSGRKLQWYHHMSNGTITFANNTGRFDLDVTTFQMAVLFAWNQRPNEKVSYENLRLATELPDPELRRTLWSLVAFPKLKRQLLVYEPAISNPKDFTENTLFWVNQEFAIIKNGKPQRRGKVNLVGRLQLSTERSQQEDNQSIVQLRILRTQEAIIKIMKMRKRLSNAALQAELVDILKNMFLPSKKMIKEQLEWLIEHKYMRRDDDDINTFIYMA